MVVYTMAQLTLIGIVFMFFDWAGLFAFLQVALMGILLLETVNYIEHYGLLRKKKNMAVMKGYCLAIPGTRTT